MLYFIMLLIYIICIFFIKVYLVDLLVNIGDLVRGGMQFVLLYSWVIFLDEKCVSFLDKIIDFVIFFMY